MSAEMQAYVLSHNRHNSLLINIESPEGVKNLDAFLSIPSLDGPGVDGIVLGPHDLSTSHEMPEKYGICKLPLTRHAGVFPYPSSLAGLAPGCGMVGFTIPRF